MGQVGDRRETTRTESLAPLNQSFSPLIDSAILSGVVFAGS
jgi:hypothetical protein